MVWVKIPWNLDKNLSWVYIVHCAGRKFKRRWSEDQPSSLPGKGQWRWRGPVCQLLRLQELLQVLHPTNHPERKCSHLKRISELRFDPSWEKKVTREMERFSFLNHDMFFHRCDVLWPGDRCAICRLHFAMGDNTLYFTCHDITLQRVESEF